MEALAEYIAVTFPQYVKTLSPVRNAVKEKEKETKEETKNKKQKNKKNKNETNEKKNETLPNDSASPPRASACVAAPPAQFAVPSVASPTKFKRTDECVAAEPIVAKRVKDDAFEQENENENKNEAVTALVPPPPLPVPTLWTVPTPPPLLPMPEFHRGESDLAGVFASVHNHISAFRDMNDLWDPFRTTPTSSQDMASPTFFYGGSQ